jgi:RimJ/RimL family protein N-acetyltransferase
MLVLKAGALSLLAYDRALAEVQARDPSAFFTRLGVAPAAPWPPEPFGAEGAAWVAQAFARDADGEGWRGWMLIADAESAQRRLVGVAALVGRPDFEGEVELGFGVLPDWRGRGFAGAAIEMLTRWACENGARRVIVHVEAGDSPARRMLARNGYRDTQEAPFPGVARWALTAV